MVRASSHRGRPLMRVAGTTPTLPRTQHRAVLRTTLCQIGLVTDSYPLTALSQSRAIGACQVTGVLSL